MAPDPRSLVALALLPLVACGGGLDQDDVMALIAEHEAQASHAEDRGSELEAHEARADAHHAPVTDAGALTTGTLDAARLPAEAALLDDLVPSGVAGVQVLDFSSILSVDSTSPTELLDLTVEPADTTDIAFSVHAYLERLGTTEGRYEVFLARESCTGSKVGYTLHRPDRGSYTYVAFSVAFTGFAEGVEPGSTFVLCARKFDGGAASVGVGPRGMTAHW